MRIAIIGMVHETNTFALEEHDKPDAPTAYGQEVLTQAHPRSYIGGFVEVASQRPDVELVPILDVSFFSHKGGMVHASVFEYYRDRILEMLKEAPPLDGVYFALHGAMAVQAPYTDAEACLIEAVRDLLGYDMPFVGTYDFHGIYTDWEVTQGLVAFPLNTNPHIDAYERGVEAAECLFAMLEGKIQPVSRRVYVPIIGPNIGQSTWSHLPADEQKLPLYQLNLLRAELEETPGVINLTIQGGYGYADTPDTGMCVIATTDGDPDLADRLARQLAQELWARREEIRTVRPILPIDEGVRRAMEHEGLVCLVDLGDDPGSSCPADSPVVLESLIRLGARDCAVTIRDPEVVKAGLAAGVGATLTMDVGAKIDQRFYKPLRVTGKVKRIDDGNYMVVGPTHGGWSRDVVKESFREESAGPRVVLRIGDKIDVIFSNKKTGKDRDFFKSAGIVFEEKRIVVVKSNQAHRASFDPIVDATFDLRTPGVSTVDYGSLPYKLLPRPIYPIDLDMEWASRSGRWQWPVQKTLRLCTKAEEGSSMQPRVFVTRPIPQKALALIESSLEVEVWTQPTVPPIRDKIAALDGLLTYGHEPVTAGMMDAAPRLKVIANVGVGYDHIDVAAATERGIAVGYTPGVLDETTADMAFALLLAAARHVARGDRFIREGNWVKYDPDLLWGAQVHGATLGIIGLGRIGRAVARRARGFDMRVLYNDRYRVAQWEEELGVEYASLPDLMSESDFVSVHTPLTSQTHHLVGKKELAGMKDTAILVNTARGPVVDGMALYEALRDGLIAGAGLDVFETEPIPPDDPLLTLENVVICPHLGSATEQTRIRMGIMAAECILAGVRGQPIPYPANPEVSARETPGG